jgi:putative transposase
MSKHTSITLSSQQRQHLETLVRTGHCAARQQTRARILLHLDRSQERCWTDAQIAEALGCHQNTVGNVRRRFLAEGLEVTLTDKPMGPTTPKKLTGDMEAKITLLACSDPPEGFARWSVRLLSERVVELGYLESFSRESARLLLKKTHSRPGVSKPGVSASPPLST